MMTWKRLALWIWIILLLLLIGVGAYGLYRLLVRTEPEAIPWALLVPGYVFFALAATGSSLINSIFLVFRVQSFKPIIKRGVWLSLILIVPAWIFILGDLGRWFQFYNLYLFFHSSSRLAWMGALYMLLAAFLLLQLIVVIREELVPRWVPLAVGIVVLLVALGVHTNLGALFEAVWTRPLWSSHLLPLHFIVSAVLVGAALHILFMSAVYLLRTGSIPDKLRELFARDYRPLMIGLIVANWILIAVEYIPGMFSPEEAPYVKLLLIGPYSPLFWLLEIAIGGVIPLMLLVHPRTRSASSWLAVASALIVVGVFFSKYDLLIGGQSISTGHFAGAFIPYAPDAMGILVLLGGIAVCLLLYTLGEQWLPLEPEKRALWFVFGQE